jgi:hypothetical protein
VVRQGGGGSSAGGRRSSAFGSKGGGAQPRAALNWAAAKHHQSAIRSSLFGVPEASNAPVKVTLVHLHGKRAAVACEIWIPPSGKCFPVQTSPRHRLKWPPA